MTAQQQQAYYLMAEYRRRLEEAGFVFGTGAMWDSYHAPDGVDPDLAGKIWGELTTSLGRLVPTSCPGGV